MNRLLPLTAVILLVIACAFADKRTNTTRSRLKTSETFHSSNTSPYDTLLIQTGDLAISGFEKTLRSRNESFFVTNHLKDSIDAINYTIDYYDMKGRQLHQRTETRRCDIPPGETRMIVTKSWDRQQVLYYHLSESPRTRAQATPFDVKINPNYILIRKN